MGGVGFSCERHSKPTEEMHIPLRTHTDTVRLLCRPRLQMKLSTSRKTLFVVDVSINWATHRN